MLDIISLDQIFGGGMTVAIVGWVLSALKSSKEAKDKRMSALEGRVSELDRIETECKESNKRVHYRVDVLEHSQSKLELKLDSDLNEVKRSIEKLSDLVIQALQQSRGH